MTRKHLRSAGRDERAFSLVELLTIILILGVLASIALPTFLSQRVKGWDANAKTDARNLAKIAVGMTTDDVDFSTLDFSDVIADGFNPSSDVEHLICVGDLSQSVAAAARHTASNNILVVDPQGRLVESTAPTLEEAAELLVSGGSCEVTLTNP